MNKKPFWQENFPRPENLPVADELPGSADVAVIGGGFTGLSAARTLAKSGTSVVVLERETIGWGASSRNGGITGCGLKAGAQTIFKRYGEKYGHIFWQASLDAVELIKELVQDEGVDCDFHQDGELCVAFKPSHFEGFKADIDWNKRVLGHELHLIPPSELKNEIGSQAYYGGLVDDHGAGLHPAKLVYGLANVAARYGAQLCEHAPVTKLEKTGGGFIVHTARGRLKVREVIAATNGYTENLVPGLKSRVIPVGSYSIVSEPLNSELQKEISPKGYMFWDSKWFLNYFRITPDGRLLWGGRNNLSTTLDLEESARILQSEMVRAFPQLENVPVTNTWTGQLGITFDLMPHIGRVRDVHYAFGYGGHGLHTALYLGRELAQLLTGEKTSSPFADIPHQTHFFYRNEPWFMPLAVQYYRLRDWIT
jgi:glycine/D-amino acid oxidase-like deaminating enzyme